MENRSNSPGNSGFDSTWTTRWRFEETKPISTYVFAFAAGPFERVEHTGGNLSGSEGVSPPANRNTLPTGRVSALGSEPGAVATGLLAPGNPVAIAPGSDRTPPTPIYVRKSQAAKFKPHAAEVFRLNREAIKYFEEYFDYKFPFLRRSGLIPEFRLADGACGGDVFAGIGDHFPAGADQERPYFTGGFDISRGGSSVVWRHGDDALV